MRARPTKHATGLSLPPGNTSPATARWSRPSPTRRPETGLRFGCPLALPLEGLLHVLAGVLDLLADLTGPAADPLALSFGLEVRIAGRPARTLLGMALGHLEPVLELVHEAHGKPPPIGAAAARCPAAVLPLPCNSPFTQNG